MTGRRATGAAALATVVVLALSGGVGHASATYSLLVSSSPDRSSPASLDGATVSGNVFAFLAPESGVTRVRFYLDDPNRLGTPWRTEKNAPWDFAGGTVTTANPFDTTTVADGSHTITAAADLSDGTSAVVSAAFTVANTVTTPPGAPDQVHLAWVGDPSTTLDVVWRTRDATSPSVVEYRMAGELAWQTASGAIRPSGTEGALHEVEITGLSPASAYEYRVPGDDGEWSPTFTTRTAPPPGPADFDAVYVADTGLVGRTDGLATGTRQVIDEIARLDPLLVLPGGDYAYYNTDDRYATLDAAIDAWFNQMQPVAASSPLMPVYGNHEALLGESVESWAARFPTPPGFDSRRNYSFDVGDVHFVAVFAVEETNDLPDATVNWIEEDITAARIRGQRWIIPYFHVSPFSDGKNHPSNLALRAQLGPLFERLGVKVAIASHDQSYERTFPLVDVPATNTPTSRDLRCYTLADGVTWLKVSPGGKLSNKNRSFSEFMTDPPPSWTAFRDNTMHHFARINVSAAGRLGIEVYGVKGDGTPPVVQDTFEYRADGCPDRLAFDPAQLSFATDQGGSPSPQVVRLLIAADEPAAFTISDDAAWLAATPVSGTTPAEITVSVDASSLAPGTYRGTVIASAEGFTSASLPVTLTVGGTYELAVSTSSDRSSAAPLASATVSGKIYVFVRPEDGISRASFWLDDPEMAGKARRTESNAPWDFAGGSVTTANPFDTTTVSDGAHTITVALDLTTGLREVVHATFTVANSTSSPPPPPPPPPPSSEVGPHELMSSTSSSRSSPILLDGATVGGTVYVFTDTADDHAGISKVEFYRNGSRVKVESNAPYDYAGGSTTTANPWDTRSVSNGSHTITAKVFHSDGVIETQSATFTVAN